MVMSTKSCMKKEVFCHAQTMSAFLSIQVLHLRLLYKNRTYKGVHTSVCLFAGLLISDGIPVFKSTKFSIWPLYLAVNELPPNHRFLRKNMLLWGVWFGAEKPDMNTFLTPFVQDMKTLKQDGNILIDDFFLKFKC